jgi:hypothetical protein
VLPPPCADDIGVVITKDVTTFSCWIYSLLFSIGQPSSMWLSGKKVILPETQLGYIYAFFLREDVIATTIP